MTRRLLARCEITGYATWFCNTMTNQYTIVVGYFTRFYIKQTVQKYITKQKPSTCWNTTNKSDAQSSSASLHMAGRARLSLSHQSVCHTPPLSRFPPSGNCRRLLLPFFVITPLRVSNEPKMIIVRCP